MVYSCAFVHAELFLQSNELCAELPTEEYEKYLSLANYFFVLYDATSYKSFTFATNLLKTHKLPLRCILISHKIDQVGPRQVLDEKAQYFIQQFPTKLLFYETYAQASGRHNVHDLQNFLLGLKDLKLAKQKKSQCYCYRYCFFCF